MCYNIATLESLGRHFSMLDGGVELTDTYKFSEKPSSISERFISLIEPVSCDEGVRVGDTLIVYDKAAFDVEINANEVSRPGSYKETVYSTDFKVKAPECEMTLKFKFI